jgi:hypothetical protein
VLSAKEAATARRNGLIEVAVMTGGIKEIFRIAERRLWLFDLFKDPRETRAATLGARLSQNLHAWMDDVQKGLIASDRLAPAEVDPENAAQLRALGYTH